MSASFNNITLFGNLGKDPEVKDFGNTKLATLALATSKKWKDKTSGEPQEKVEWHTVKVWGAQADFVEQYAKKGSKVLISGELQYESWEKDGVKHTKAVVVARELSLA